MRPTFFLRLGLLLALLISALPLTAQTAKDYDASAKAKLARNDFDGAIADLGKRIALEPANATAYLDRIHARKAKLEFDDDEDVPASEAKLEIIGAIFSDYDKAIALDPKNATTWFERAMLKFGSKLEDAALPDLDAAIALKPDYAEAYYYRAQLRFSEGADEHAIDDLAIADLNNAIASKPDFADAYRARAGRKQDKGDFDGAISDLSRTMALKGGEEAAKRDEDIAYLWIERGQAKKANGDLDGAIADFDVIIRFKPEVDVTHDAYEERSLVRRLKHDEAGADADSFQATALHSFRMDDYDDIWNAGRKVAKGDFTGAVADYDQAIAKKADFYEDAQLSRSIALCRLNHGDSFAELKKEIAGWKDGDWRKFIGLYLTGTLSENDFLREAATNDKYWRSVGPYEDWKQGFYRGVPSMVTEQKIEAFYFIGMAHLLAGDKVGAKEFLEKCMAKEFRYVGSVTFIGDDPVQTELDRLTASPVSAAAP